MITLSTVLLITPNINVVFFPNFATSFGTSGKQMIMIGTLARLSRVIAEVFP